MHIENNFFTEMCSGSGAGSYVIVPPFVVVPPPPPDGGPQVCLGDREGIRGPCVSKGGQFKNNYFTEMCSGSEAGSYLRPIDVCILNSRLESNNGEEEERGAL